VLLYVLIAGPGLSGRVRASEPAPYAVAAREITATPVMDGALDETIWTSSPPIIAEFIQQRPDEGQPASQKTEVWVAYDATSLYFAVMCYDTEPDAVVATEMRRDADLTEDDFIEIILDTFHDRQNGFLFATNPAGARFDAQVRNEGLGITRGQRSPTGRPNTSENYNVDWDGVWTTGARRLPNGWSAEIAIPFTTLRYKKGENVSFGMNIQRQIRRRNEQAFWSPVPRPYTIFKVSSAGQLKGIRLPEPKRNFKIKPFTLTGAQSDFTRTDGRRNDGRLDAGGDLKYGLTSNMVLDLTFNTDFSQVESDEDQVNLSQFSLFFPEKREFFLENAGLFSFGSVRVGPSREMEMFFSRRIGLFEVGRGDTREVPIIGGVRVTGKAGRFNVGLINITTDEIRFQKTAGDTLVPTTNFTVARFTRDIFKKSNIGVSVMNKQASLDHRYSRVVSGDMNLSFGDHFTSNAFLSGSFTGSDRPHRDGTGIAGMFVADWKTNLYEIKGGYRSLPADFNNEFGFIRRSGIRGYDAFLALTQEPRASLIRQNFPHFNFTLLTDRSNDQVSRREHYGYTIIFRDGTQTELAVNRQFERVDAQGPPILGVPIKIGRYGYTDVFYTFSFNPSKRIFGSVNATIGQFYDGNRRQVTADGGIRFGSALSIQERYEYNRIALSTGSARTHLLTTRFNYSFSTRLSTRALIQYNSLTGEINTNFRVRFLTTPGSDMFIVYNERRVTDDQTFPATSIDGFGVKDRTVAVKFTYLFEL
jgi:hypothetical protein